MTRPPHREGRGEIKRGKKVIIAGKNKPFLPEDLADGFCRRKRPETSWKKEDYPW